MKNPGLNVVDSLKKLSPKKDGIYTKIIFRFLINSEFLIKEGQPNPRWKKKVKKFNL